MYETFNKLKALKPNMTTILYLNSMFDFSMCVLVQTASHFPKIYVLLTLHEAPVRAMLALTTIPALPTMHATLARYNLAGLVAEREAAGQRILLRDKNDKLVILCNDGNYYWFVAVVQ
jgi:hypothetical protein